MMLVLKCGRTEWLVIGRVELIYEMVDWLGFMICLLTCLLLPLLRFLDFSDCALVRTWQQQGFSTRWWGQNEHFLKLLVYLFISISNLTDTFYIYYLFHQLIQPAFTTVSIPIESPGERRQCASGSSKIKIITKMIILLSILRCTPKLFGRIRFTY